MGRVRNGRKERVVLETLREDERKRAEKIFG